MNKANITCLGTCLVSGSEDKTLVTWNMHTGSKIYTVHGHSDAITAIKIQVNRFLKHVKWQVDLKIIKNCLQNHLYTMIMFFVVAFLSNNLRIKLNKIFPPIYYKMWNNSAEETRFMKK